MSDYTNTFDAANKDATNADIFASDIGTELDAISTSVASKANKVVPLAVGNVATLSAGGDLVDSGILLSTKMDKSSNLSDVASAVTSFDNIKQAATDSYVGAVELATNAEAQALSDNTRVITPASLASVTATDSRTGIIEIATDAEVETGTDTSRAITPAGLRAKSIVLGTPVTTTSGTSVDFTGIPSWAKRITVMMSGVSTSGTDNKLIQIGTSAGIEATGYAGAGSVLTTTINSSSGFVLNTTVASNIHHGAFVLSLLDSSTYTWVMSGVGALSDSQYMLLTSGSKSLIGILDRVRITTVSGTDTFDAGTINVSWE